MQPQVRCMSRVGHAGETGTLPKVEERKARSLSGPLYVTPAPASPAGNGKAGFLSRLSSFRLARLYDYEQLLQQLLHSDGVQEHGVGTSLISRTSISNVRVSPARG